MNTQWPIITELDKQRVLECLEEGRLWRGNAKYIFEFEKSFSELHGVDFCLSVTNGTHALELALESLGIGSGDEVLIPAYTFISTATAVLIRNAIPIPVEVCEDTYCINPLRIEEQITSKTKAIIPVHIAGHACDMDEIMKIAGKHNLYIIEDCAHAHGSVYKEKPLGSFGDVGTFSFQASKVMTAGEGGAFITKSKEVWEKASLIFNCGRPMGATYDHLLLSSNYRMSELQAALLLGQIDRLKKQIETRNSNTQFLNKCVKNIDGIRPQQRKEYATVQGYSMYMFRYQKEYFNNLPREMFINYLIDNGIPAFKTYPIFFETSLFDNLKEKYTQFHHYNRDIQYSSDDFPISKKISEEVVWIPHYYLFHDQIDLERTAQIIRKFVEVYD
ncbi:DegT/DnrJ/EryC1/StrS family aminotransferase [Paenibacillus nuruki]|uniref:DegT/DnrJ/EryC1/StrS family aminotransferase n=1 Tax=Paenibacillus nuruki TaxID=1886670 RepID=UPI0015860874|nr:DegT/DnrJ/EryC1/StrS family aminotransferase [Paenibacillus nuruki]